MLAAKFALPVDERAIRALVARLSSIKYSNGYYVNVLAVRRYRGTAQLDLIRESAEIHVVSGYVMRSDLPYEVVDRRSAAMQWWANVPVSVMFFLRTSQVPVETGYRVMKADIIRCLLNGPIVDSNGFEYPILIGPDPYGGDDRFEMRCYPLYINDKPEYAAGVIELNLLASFNLDSPYLADSGDTMVFAKE